MKSIAIALNVVLFCISNMHYAFAQEQLPPQVVILQYHHISSTTPAITSVSPETFKAHMQYLSENHSVIRLKDALEAIQEGRSLPANAISITFDDGYENILTNGHPILTDFNFPYTIFINPDSIGNLGGQLTWDQVKQMAPLADFANHTLDHLHLLQREPLETESQWLMRVMSNIEQAEKLLLQALGYSYRWLAYPYGEYNLSLQKAISEAGYIGFGQQSGAVAKHSEFSALPRFPAAGRYANLDTLKVKMASIAMPVVNHYPQGHQRKVGDVMTKFTLELKTSASNVNGDMNQSQMACFFHGERFVPSINNNEISITLNHTFKPGRVRINCTAPSKQFRGRFYWHSVAFFTPTKDGRFLE